MFIFALAAQNRISDSVSQSCQRSSHRGRSPSLDLVFSTGSDPIAREFTMTNIGTGELDIEQLEI